MKTTWESDCGTVKLWLADCLTVLPTIGGVDAVVTDPPYGVGFGYLSYDDDPAEHDDKCAVWLNAMRATTDGPICIFSGIRGMWSWPKAHWVMSWRKTFSVSRSPFGSNNWEPILVYNKGRKGETASDSFEATFIHDVVAAGHPCPKPIRAKVEVIRRCSVKAEAICDPFMGSGTTGVAAVRTGRKFYGIEIDPTYFEIAKRRIQDELNRYPLFDERVAEQQELFAEVA